MSRTTPPTSFIGPAFHFPLHTTTVRLIDQTYRTAAERRVPPSSNHLLAALLSLDTEVRSYLHERDPGLLHCLGLLDLNSVEPKEVLALVWNTADSIGESGPSLITPMHLLAGLLSYHNRSLAVGVLRGRGLDTAKLRSEVLALLAHWHQQQQQQRAAEAGNLSRSGEINRLSRSTEMHRLNRTGELRRSGEMQRVTRSKEAPATTRSGEFQVPPSEMAYPTRRKGDIPAHAPAHEHNPWPQRGARPETEEARPRLAPSHPLNVPNPYLPPPAGPSGYSQQPPPQPRQRPQVPRGRGTHSGETMLPPRLPQARQKRHTPPQRRHTSRPASVRPTSPKKSGSTPNLPKHPSRRSSSTSSSNRSDLVTKHPLAEKLRGRFGSRRNRVKPAQPVPVSQKDLASSLFGDGLSIDDLIARADEEARDSGSKRRRRPAGRPPKEEQPSKTRSKTKRSNTRSRPKTPSVTPSKVPRLTEQPAIVGKAKTPEPPEVSPRDVEPSAPQPCESKLHKISQLTLSAAQQSKLEEQYALDPKEFPFLSDLGRNISLEAIQGDIDDLVGREAEIDRMIDILNKRRNNNPLLVGPAGVGKTAIVEGLALSLINPDADGAERILIELQMGRILSGTHLRGSFSERLIRLKDEVHKAAGRVIIFLDEIHTWMGAGASGDGADASNELKAALARGNFPCVGATTEEEYKRFIEADYAFRRRFQKINVDEPSREEAIEVIRGLLSQYSKHHDVAYDDDAVEAAVNLSARYIPEQQLPDKAFNLIDMSGSRARRQGLDRVDREVVAGVVSDQTGVPIDKLLMRDRERLLRMEEVLSASLIGHRQVVTRLSEVIRRNYAGFHSGRPIGSFLFLGPTGVGKTELVKVLADFLFRDRNAIVRLDMSEFTESHSISRIVGAPPGYVGFDQGGQLTDAIRRSPYQIILFDEIEKAHPEVLNILLQLLDDGRLTDGRGRTVNFSNTVVIMTSNLGADHFAASLEEVTLPRIGFGSVDNGAYLNYSARAESVLSEELCTQVCESAKKAMPRELWNRISERLVFGPLSRDEVARIARLQFNDSARRLSIDRHILMEAHDRVFDFLIDNGGYDPEFGARPMRQTLERLVETRVADMILTGALKEGQRVYVDIADDILAFTVKAD